MRRNRIILLALWLLSLAGITFIGGQVSYGLFALFSLIPFLSLFYVFCVSKAFKIYQHINTQDIIANRKAPYEFVLHNDSFIPFAGLRVVFFSRFSFIDGFDPSVEYELLPGDSIRMTSDLVCRYRGEYNVGIESIVIEDYFRLFSLTHMIKDPLIARARPDIVDAEDLKQAQPAFNAVTQSQAKRSTADILSREYVVGDDPRLINWKVSAALGKLMVREMIGEEQQGVGIVMDSRRYSSQPEEYLPIENKILETVIALSLFFSKRGIPVSVYLEAGDPIRIDLNKDRGFEELYEMLSAFSFNKNRNSRLCDHILSSESAASKAAVFFVVHRWKDSFPGVAEHLRKYNVQVNILAVKDNPDQDASEVPSDIIYIDPDQDLKEVL